MTRVELPEGFLFGASTSAHQVEGGNVASDWWRLERSSLGAQFVREPSGDAADSYHRWPQDMDLLRDLGFNAYRFSVEWARIEPERGEFSRAQIDHYRRMVHGALERGLQPVVTLHHFTSPHWFTEGVGWTAAEAPGLFARYIERAAPVIAEGVRYVATINEPNMMAGMITVLKNGTVITAGASLPPPDLEATEALIRAHRAARAAVKAIDPGIQVGWSVANQDVQAVDEPGAAEAAAAYVRSREDVFVEAAREDDWVGVQAYTRTLVGADGPLPVPGQAERTIKGWEYYPEALGHAVRRTAGVVGPHVPIIVTENGIATADDRRRIDYTTGALDGLAAAMRDGIDVRGYLHWSALDNYEWGSFAPTFGLIGVDRETFERTPKPSAYWLGALARERRLR